MDFEKRVEPFFDLDRDDKVIPMDKPEPRFYVEEDKSKVIPMDITEPLFPMESDDSRVLPMMYNPNEPFLQE